VLDALDARHDKLLLLNFYLMAWKQQELPSTHEKYVITQFSRVFESSSTISGFDKKLKLS
jgi:hypothetical protein